MNKLPTIIAEVKTGSPFGNEGFSDDWDERFAICEEVGDIISFHTESPWNGSIENLAKGRRSTEKPILAKGLHKKDFDITTAIEEEANHVLVFNRIPSVLEYDKELMEETLFIEPHRLRDLEEFVRVYPEGRYVWNSRDLKNNGKSRDKKMFEKARKIVGDGWLCQASNIRRIDDVYPCADAVLVGTHIREFRDSLINRL